MSAEPLVLDLRGLEPPEPLVRSLEAASRLGPGEELRIRTDRRPVHLLPILEQRGLSCAGEERDGYHETIVRRG